MRFAFPEEKHKMVNYGLMKRIEILGQARIYIFVVYATSRVTCQIFNIRQHQEKRKYWHNENRKVTTHINGVTSGTASFQTLSMTLPVDAY